MRLLAGIWLGMAAVLLVGAAYQLSPVDEQQNARLATIEAYLFATPTQEWAITPTPTRHGATATLAPTFTAVPLATSTPTELPPQVSAGNISGASLWVRSCPSQSCEILARVRPGELIKVDPRQTFINGDFEWVALWNQSDGVTGGYIAFRQISPPVRYLRW